MQLAEPKQIELSEESRSRLGPSEALNDKLRKQPLSSLRHVLGIDIGQTNNSLALVAVCCPLPGLLVTSLAFEIAPYDDRSTNLADIFDNVILPLTNMLNVVGVFYDRYQSVQHMQSLALRRNGVAPGASHYVLKKSIESGSQFVADQYSLSADDARSLVALVESGQCLFPAAEMPLLDLLFDEKVQRELYPYAHLALQLATVRVRGRSLMKPVRGEDDLFRAWANAVVKARDPFIAELLSRPASGVRQPALGSGKFQGSPAMVMSKIGQSSTASARSNSVVVNGSPAMLMRKGGRKT